MPRGNPGIPKSPEHIEKMRAALLGKPKSEEHKAALRKPKSEEHKKALSAAAINKSVIEKRAQTMFERYGIKSSKEDPFRNNNCVEYWIAKGYTKDEAKTMISDAQSNRAKQRKNNRSIWQTSYWESKGLSPEESKQKVSEIQSINSSKSSCSISIEGKNFFDALSLKLELNIEREVIIGPFKVDGYIKETNTVIEYFGSFWHMHPSLFEEHQVHRVTGWSAKSKWAEDRGRIKKLTHMGYNVIVVWDFEAFEKINFIVEEINARRKG